jgi:DNA-binding GntR family transcriptional regulator
METTESPELRLPGSKGVRMPNSPELVVEELRRAILRRELAPGEHVRQPAWAERLGVSRAVLREAFKILTGQRLLRHSPHSGYFVAKLSASEMTQLYRIRMFVEEEILRTIRWPSKEEIAVLGELSARYQAILMTGDITTAMDCWREYTKTLFDLSPLEFTVSEAMRLWEMAAPYRVVGLTAQLLQDGHLRKVERGLQQQLTALRRHDVEMLIDSFVRRRTADTDRAVLLLLGERT